MVCVTIREGYECAFMTAKGCGYKGGNCNEIVDQCDGCNRSIELSSGWYCSAYPEPAAKWKNSSCNFATHVTTDDKVAKVKINPLKASKRGSR